MSDPFEIMSQADYLATCNQCGRTETNAAMKEHQCTWRFNRDLLQNPLGQDVAIVWDDEYKPFILAALNSYMENETSQRPMKD